MLKHLIAAAIALSPVTAHPDSAGAPERTSEDVVEVSISVTRENTAGGTPVGATVLAMMDGTSATLHTGSTLSMTGEDSVVTGLTISVRAHRATENVVALRLSMSHNEMIRMVEGQRPEVKIFASETDRWLSLPRGETIRLRIGEDDVALKAL